MPKSILIVDDEELVRSVYRDAFEESGYNVVEADNGVDGYNKLKSESIDLAIVDLRMPVCDGLSMIKKIRKAGYGDLPVIIVPGHSPFTDEEIRELGVNKVFQKSQGPDVLIDYVNEVVFGSK